MLAFGLRVGEAICAIRVSLALRGRNPDILTCIANLSNDEVFTPPEFANRMLDTLARDPRAENNSGADLWADSSVRFLDPFTKSGVFLREIASRPAQTGLAAETPDLQKRVDHIRRKQVFGIGITHLTSLWRAGARCIVLSMLTAPTLSPKAFPATRVTSGSSGTEHTWVEDKRKFCGRKPKYVFDRGEVLETHAYVIHPHGRHQGLGLPGFLECDMQFDVGRWQSAIPARFPDGGYVYVPPPIYDKFVGARHGRLTQRFPTMVIPARWFAGGKGL